MSCTGAIPKRGARPVNKDKDGTEVCGEPLDEKYMNVPNQGNDRRVPALHKYWTQKGTYLKYVRPPPPVLPDGSPPPAGASESWVEQMELMEEDLRSLLCLPHHKFWSQMIYDPNVHLCLESYLSAGPRWYEEDQVDVLCKEMVGSLHRLVLLIYLRIATPRESQSCHITPTVFAQMIYENFLLDVCQLLDLSVVYGPSCGPLLTRMFACVFRHQPEYYRDLTHTASSIALALEGVEDKLRVSDYEIPLPLDAVMENLSESDLQTVVLFLLDTFSSLHLFLSLHPPAAKCFFEDVNELRIASFYERVVCAITNQLRELSQGSELNPRLVKEINLMRSSMLATFRALLHHKCLAPIQEEKSGTAMVGECVEKFLHIMTTCVGERIFITDYCSAYPIDTDFKTFMDKEGDVTSLTFVHEAITTVLKEMDTSPRMGALPLEHMALPDTTKTSQESMDTSGMNGYAQEGPSSATPDLDVAAGVSSVQELLPDLGAGFIKECLRYYNHRPEEVINALLEDNLPPSLASLDRSAPLRPATPPPAEEENKEVSLGLLEQRSNVYDHDEFDMFTRKDVDRSKIHKGKKATNTKKVLYEKDEETIDKLKEIGRHYEERGGTSIYEDEFRYEAEDEGFRAWDYEDEYDDTYDDNETGDIDNMGPEKMVKRRPGIIGAGRLNTNIDYGKPNNSDEEKSDAEADDTSKQQQQPESDANGIQGRWTRQPPGAKSNQPKTNTRGVQRVFNKSSSKPGNAYPAREKENGPGGERREEREEYSSTPPPPPQRPAFQAFCENPEVLRQRAEQRRRDRDYNRGRRGRGGEQPWREPRLTNGVEDGGGGGGGPGRPRVASTKNSGKGWRHGDGGDEDRGGYRGGKVKEDTNHGRAQSQQHRHKMVHKNEHKRQGAQAKFNRNN